MEPDWQGYERYVKWWQCALREILGWASERSLAWAEQWKRHIQSYGDGAFFNELPAYYIVPLLCPRLMSKKREEISRMESELTRAFGRDFANPENLDWRTIQTHVERILAAHGERLPKWELEANQEQAHRTLPMEPIEREFAARGVVRGGLLLLQAPAALDMVRRCREEGIKVLGLDAFSLSEHTTQPLMEQSTDLTKSGHSDSWTEAESFLIGRIHSDLYFEVVIETLGPGVLGD